ncbi:MAG TPA: aminopeptidase P family protein, partial [Candidatus Nitrosotalea sp.]|nr:aminopeptidase P family protein [Candidatus Nitrosotalea sp.]
MNARRKNLLKFCNSSGCDTLVAFEPENLFYMTGFWGEAIGILDKTGATIIAPELEMGRAKEESANCKVIKSERGKGSITTLIEALKGRKVCTDTNSYDVVQTLKKYLPKVRSTTEPFYRARQVKDRGEISILKKCSSILDEMYELCVDEIKIGMSEMELQSILMSYAMERGAFATGYKSTLQPLIIAGGPNSALPHAQVTDRKFEDGDMIVVDLTLRHKGYVSDATRTFGLGSVSAEAKKIYEIVRRSQEAGIKKIRPGIACKSVDDTCRKIITSKGYGKYFIHSTGHGIGLEVHELPNIGPSSQAVLSRNMTVTVEPGIYLPKKFGVRIEDSLVVGSRAEVMH